MTNESKRWTEGVDVFTLARQFNKEIIGLPVPSEPQMLMGHRGLYAVKHLTEEARELAEATTVEDQVDALVDSIYVAAGRLFEMGVDPGAHFLEVHAANMRRVRGNKPSRPDAQGFDAVKPEGWVGPDHSAVLRGEGVVGFLEDDGSSWRPKLLIMGFGRHGKDTVSELLRDKYGFSFTSSSRFCAERVMMPLSQAVDNSFPLYADAEACFNDRHSHRSAWFQAIEAYNQPDMSRLGREIFAENDVYCGIRSEREFNALRNKGVYDAAIWVDASYRGLPPEGHMSCSVEPWMADFVLDNGGSLEDLERNLAQLMWGQFGIKPLEGR